MVVLQVFALLLLSSSLSLASAHQIEVKTRALIVAHGGHQINLASEHHKELDRTYRHRKHISATQSMRKDATEIVVLVKAAIVSGRRLLSSSQASQQVSVALGRMLLQTGFGAGGPQAVEIMSQPKIPGTQFFLVRIGFIMFPCEHLHDCWITSRSSCLC